MGPRLWWNYELSHPIMPAIFADTGTTLRFFGVTLTKTLAFGLLIRRRAAEQAEEHDSE